MKTPLCNGCELHSSKKRIVVKLDSWANKRKVYLCSSCYYKIVKELGIGDEE